MRIVLAAAVMLAACDGATVVGVDTQLGEWSQVQAWADRDCTRAGFARGQFVGRRDRTIQSGSGEDAEMGDQRYAEFVCRPD